MGAIIDREKRDIVPCGTPEPRWGAEGRELRAMRIRRTLENFLPEPLARLTCVDLGCGSAGIARSLAPAVGRIIAVDPEPWARWMEFRAEHSNLSFVCGVAESICLRSDSVDLVLCNQIYEHVADPAAMIGEIHRVLRPGGTCYFAGPNRAFPIEPHVFWPFIHWLPRRMASRLLKLARCRGVTDARSVTHWTLRRWFAGFQVEDIVVATIRDPERFGLHGWVWRIFSKIPACLLRFALPLSPGFAFLLKKPAALGAPGTGSASAIKH